jgi:hypothetical protein
MELIPGANRIQLGDALIKEGKKTGFTDNILWCIARLGARQLFYGPTNQVLTPAIATRWIEALIAIPKAVSDGKEDSTAYVAFSETDYRSKPGKLISFVQTFLYLKQKIRHALFGSGVGRFSSKLAFRASGVGILGTYPSKYAYVAPEFRYNHLKTFLFYYNAEASQHSVMNYPFSVYNQVFGEYGLVGVLIFILFYLGYFLSRFRLLTYGRYMIVLLLAFFLMEYWFELFSLIVLFELFMFLNIREQTEKGKEKAKPGEKISVNQGGSVSSTYQE